MNPGHLRRGSFPRATCLWGLSPQERILVAASGGIMGVLSEGGREAGVEMPVSHARGTHTAAPAFPSPVVRGGGSVVRGGGRVVRVVCVVSEGRRGAVVGAAAATMGRFRCLVLDKLPGVPPHCL